MTFPIAHAKAQRREGPCGRPPEKNFAALRLCVIFSLLLFAAAAAKAQTNVLSDAEIQGRQLAQKLLTQQPANRLLQTGSLKIRDGRGFSTNFPLKFLIRIRADCWESVYQIVRTNVLSNGETYPAFEQFVVSHYPSESNSYLLGTYGGDSLEEPRHGSIPGVERNISASNLMTPFASSDFFLADLGLEFFHWPQQKVLPKTTNLKRGRYYTLLESTNPNPATNGYSRVLSWIDKETGGILEAEAYDAQNKLLKVFEPKSFKKVNGQWELQEMEIRNVQSGSRTRLEFDLKK